MPEVSRKELPGAGTTWYRRGQIQDEERASQKLHVTEEGDSDRRWEGHPAREPTPAALTDQRLQALARGGVPDPTATQEQQQVFTKPDRSRSRRAGFQRTQTCRREPGESCLRAPNRSASSLLQQRSSRPAGAAHSRGPPAGGLATAMGTRTGKKAGSPACFLAQTLQFGTLFPQNHRTVRIFGRPSSSETRERIQGAAAQDRHAGSSESATSVHAATASAARVRVSARPSAPQRPSSGDTGSQGDPAPS